MSFGIGKDTPDSKQQADEINKIREFKEELTQNATNFIKKRQETLQMLKS